MTAAAHRGALASSFWTTNEDSPRYSLSSSFGRHFSTVTDEETNKTADDTNSNEDTSKAPEEIKSKQEDIPKESLQFQAETRQLLDIVTHSLYTEKEGEFCIMRWL